MRLTLTSGAHLSPFIWSTAREHLETLLTKELEIHFPTTHADAVTYQEASGFSQDTAVQNSAFSNRQIWAFKIMLDPKETQLAAFKSCRKLPFPCSFIHKS
jgi:hypothetical protein